MQTYSLADQQAVAMEVYAAPPSAEWPIFMTDYKRLRDEVRACRGDKQ